MKYVSKFILVELKNGKDIREVKAVPLNSKSIKAFVYKDTRGTLTKREGWVITIEETGCYVNNILYPTVKDAQHDWDEVEERCLSLLENPRIKEGYEEKKKIFTVLLKEYHDGLKFVEELLNA